MVLSGDVENMETKSGDTSKQHSHIHFNCFTLSQSYL